MVLGNRPQQKNKGLCILAVHSFFYDMRGEITWKKKSMKKSFSSLGWRFLIGTLIIYAVQIAVVAVVGQVKPEWLENTTINLILAVLPLYLIGMPVLIALVKQIPGEAPAKKSMKPGQFIVALIMCYALMYCGNLVGTLITTVVGALKGSEVDNALMAYATESNMMVTFLYMVICAPILEEYIFRKLIVDRTVKYGQGVAIVLSGLMFGLFHGNLTSPRMHCCYWECSWHSCM